MSFGGAMSDSGGTSGAAAPAFAPISVTPTLFDPGGRVDDPDTGFDASTGTVVFQWNAAGGTAAVGGISVNAPRYSWLISDLFPLFDTSKHILHARLSSISLTNNLRDAGLGVWVSDDPDTGGTGGGGGVVVDSDGSGTDDRPGETSATTSTIGTTTGDNVDALECTFTFLDQGDLECTEWVTDTTGELRNRGTRRNMAMSSRPAANAAYLQVALPKILSGALVSGDEFTAVVEVAMGTRPT